MPTHSKHKMCIRDSRSGDYKVFFINLLYRTPHLHKELKVCLCLLYTSSEAVNTWDIIVVGSPWPLIGAYLVVINLIALLMMWSDKRRSKKDGARRISEKALFLSAIDVYKRQTISSSCSFVTKGFFIFRFSSVNAS